jgi:hypothetical protein
MRPGEKLYEELNTVCEDTAPTAHEKIRIFMGNGIPEGDIGTWLDCLRQACQARDVGRLVVALKEIVLDYNPSTHLLKRIIDTRGHYSAATVAEGDVRKRNQPAVKAHDVDIQESLKLLQLRLG